MFLFMLVSWIDAQVFIWHC